jgi:hypothetical protein
VREWIAAHNRCVKASGRGLRIVPTLLPTKSPWLNAIEPQWIHGKRKVEMVGATIRTVFAQSPTQGALASNGVGSQMASGIGSGGSRS